MVSKFDQHLHHFSDIDRLLKQIWPVWIFLNWCFHHKNSLITHSMWFKMSNLAEQHKYFSIFQQPDWVQQLDCEFDQDADFKKLVSYIIAGVLIWWWVQTLVSQNAKPTPHPLRSLIIWCWRFISVRGCNFFRIEQKLWFSQ